MNDCADNSSDLSSLQISITARQDHLHGIVEALYSKQLLLEPCLVEALLRIADFLGMSCIMDACQQYLRDEIVKECPVQVIFSRQKPVDRHTAKFPFSCICTLNQLPGLAIDRQSGR